MADYVLLRFTDRDKKRIDEKLTGLIRGSDMLGLDNDGNICLLLVQMNRDNLAIVGDRLHRQGIAYEVVEENR